MPKPAPLLEDFTRLSELERLHFGPLVSETTRTERRYLFISALLGLAISQAGFLPSKISALGIEFERTSQRSVLLLVALVLIYFVITFVLYAAADWVAWRSACNEALARHLREEPALIPKPDAPDDKPWQRVQKELIRARARLASFSRHTAKVRATWEFLLPILVGVYAVAAVLVSRSHIP